MIYLIEFDWRIRQVRADAERDGHGSIYDVRFDCWFCWLETTFSWWGVIFIIVWVGRLVHFRFYRAQATYVPSLDSVFQSLARFTRGPDPGPGGPDGPDRGSGPVLSLHT